MKSELERELWQRIKKQPSLTGDTPREVIAELCERGDIASPKQAWATLEKWDSAGLYDYGVALDMGWINEGAQMPARLHQARPLPDVVVGKLVEMRTDGTALIEV